jgi:hypothetical protein
VKLGIGLAHHDHAYVERRGGWELLTHLRGGDVRADYRTRALQRALKRFEAERDNGAPEAQVGGHGLLVLQRALLAAEDLGGLLHAFSGPEPWTALRLTKIPDLNAAYAGSKSDPLAVLESAFRLTTEQQLVEEGFGERELQAFRRLRSLTQSCWTTLLARVAELWTAMAPIAKATMHGFPIVAGPALLGPPPAGELAAVAQRLLEGLRPQRFAVAIPAKQTGTQINTEVIPIALGDDAVAHYHGTGITAARLYSHLCEAQAGSIMGGYGAMLSGHLLDKLPAEDQELIAPLLMPAPEEES